MGIEDVVNKRIGTLARSCVGCGDLDAYEKLEKIGVGGSGTVWKVKIGHELYAMKAPNFGNGSKDDISGTICFDQDSQETFLAEARNWARLTDNVPDAIVCLKDFNVEPFPWMVMELADGDLEIALKNREFDIEMFASLLWKLQKIHDNGVIHRDIKPENILLLNGNWKFSDFGLSKHMSSRSMTGSIKGTPIYMAPEQIDHRRFGQTDRTTDLWQMGVILYRMVVGRNPYGDLGDDLFAFVNEICNYGPDLSAVPKEWFPIFEKVFQKDRSKRFQSAEEFAKTIESVKIDEATGFHVQIPVKEVEIVSTSEALKRGIQYYEGAGVEQSYLEAAKWFTQAAEAGDPEAQYRLGMMFYEKKGVSRSYLRARELLRRAAIQGNADAQRILSKTPNLQPNRNQLYNDLELSIEFAEYGNSEAQYCLGMRYREGRGVKKSAKMAADWFRKSAGSGNTASQQELCTMYRKNLATPTSEELKTEWYKKNMRKGIRNLFKR